jgi:hypothetical protein
MTILKLLTILNILWAMLNSGMLTSSQRQKYLKQFVEALALLHSGGNIYLPPWIRRQLVMNGMRKYLVRRLMCHPDFDMELRRRSNYCFKSYSGIMFTSLNFLRYSHTIFDPSRLDVKLKINAKSPLACCWHLGIGKLLVTTQTHILAGDITGVNPRFTKFYKVPLGNNYGIDVAPDGTIVLIGYNANLIYLISPQGKLIASHVIFHGTSTTYSGVSFSHDGTHILCFSRKGIHILRRDGTFLCTVGGEGSRPGFFRGEGQIGKLAWRNRFAISDIENNRIQIVEIDFQSRTMKVLKIIGTNFFYKPLGLVEMGNCILAFSHDDGCAYVWDGERTIQILDRRFVGVRFACKLPNGSIAICNKQTSDVSIIQENTGVPSGINCLDLRLRNKSNKKSLTCVADSGVQTSVLVTQVSDSAVKTSIRMTQVADSSVQTSDHLTQISDSGMQTSDQPTQVIDLSAQIAQNEVRITILANSPNESIFERIFNAIRYFLGYQLF